MKLRADAGPLVLTSELERLLLDGPASIGKTERQLPPYEELRRTWLAHAAVLEGKRRDPWFPQHDWWVRTVQGEELPLPPRHRVDDPPGPNRYILGRAARARSPLK